MEKDKGLLVVLSGPSGVGKGTVCAALRERSSQVIYSVSATTRAPREGEQEGINYFFKTKQQFQSMIDHDELLEWAQYVDRFYGTPKAYVKEQLDNGHDVLLEIEVQGALQVKKKHPEGIFIFLSPPSLEELKDRIVNRGTETEESINHRLDVAQHELDMMTYYDYVVVNDKVERACERIEAIILAEHCRSERKLEQYKPILHKRGG